MLSVLRRCLRPRTDHERPVPGGARQLQLEPRGLRVEADEREGQLPGPCGGDYIVHQQQHGRAESRYQKRDCNVIFVLRLNFSC